jgi:hypothetical protein
MAPLNLFGSRHLRNLRRPFVDRIGSRWLSRSVKRIVIPLPDQSLLRFFSQEILLWT